MRSPSNLNADVQLPLQISQGVLDACHRLPEIAGVREHSDHEWIAISVVARSDGPLNPYRSWRRCRLLGRHSRALQDCVEACVLGDEQRLDRWAQWMGVNEPDRPPRAGADRLDDAELFEAAQRLQDAREVELCSSRQEARSDEPLTVLSGNK